MICQSPIDKNVPLSYDPTCPTTFGQIQRIFFQRIRKDDGTLNGFIKSTLPPTSAQDWLPFVGGEEDYSICVAPFVHNPAMDGGDALVYGSGNEVIDGIPIVISSEAIKFTGEFHMMPQMLMRTLKHLGCACEELGVYFVEQYNRIGCHRRLVNGLYHYYPIPIKAFFLGDMIMGGLEEPNKNLFEFYLRPNYSDDFYIIVPDDGFSPLTDLAKKQTYEEVVFTGFCIQPLAEATDDTFSFTLSRKIMVESLNIYWLQGVQNVKTTITLHYELNSYSCILSVPDVIDTAQAAKVQVELFYEVGDELASISTDAMELSGKGVAQKKCVTAKKQKR